MNILAPMALASQVWGPRLCLEASQFWRSLHHCYWTGSQYS